MTNEASPATQERARSNHISLVRSDGELCEQADYVLSIVPPKEAVPTAVRIMDITSDPDFQRRESPLYYLELNAISPSSARQVDQLFTSCGNLRYIDGGIIGGPPSLKQDGTWSSPSIPLSGPHGLADAPSSGKHLSNVLNAKHINEVIGSASGLKMCFATLSKGFTALAILSFTTARSLGVLEELQSHLDEHSPGVRSRAERGLVSMPPKAYRWVNEMEQIAETFEADGGFLGDESIFRSIAQVYELVANETELGEEVTEARQQGTTADDVARLMVEGNERRKVKKD